MILFVVFCVNFEFDTVVSCQMNTLKLFGSDTEIFVVTFDGWLADCVLWIIWNLL